jgi:ribonuclease G
MSKEMIISVNGREKKIAILDNGKVTEFYIERGEEGSGVVGNIYKGRVMRVLPGMQSAFVEIGLERDAFLYVSDFFDEEEEIERIVMEKSKKTSPEEAKREADDRIDRARIEREKQMEAVQEIAEPMSETAIEASAPDERPARQEQEPERKGRRRGRRDKSDEMAARPEPILEFDDSGFERIVDDEGPGDIFKDAYMQEAIIDKVRAIEFEMESTAVAEVGSLISEVEQAQSGFERIADEDEEPRAAKEKGKSRGGKAAKAKTSKNETPQGQDSEEAPKKKGRSTKSTAKSKSKKAKDDVPADESGTSESGNAEQLQDAEANIREASDTAGMTVRRGGRGRRRGGRGRRPDKPGEESETPEITDVGSEENEIVETEFVAEASEPVEPAAAVSNGDPGKDGRDRKGRGFQNGGRRNDRNDRGDRRDRAPQATISDLLREGQEIIVQIAKEPIARKGARITSHIALPGRFLVYMPTIEHLGVSRKIESSNERGRLRTLIQRIRQDKDILSGGFIVRTAGIGISEEDLRNDAKYLVRTWQDIKKSSEKAKSPAMVHQDLDLVQRILRDQLSDNFSAIRVDSEDEYLRTVEFVNRMAPRMVNRVKLYTRDEPILEAYNVQEEIDKALKPRVWLKSGGYLVINQTEALVAIDVNTGKFVGKGNARLEDTITKTNLEAVDEIARQIRLRDLGGIIVLDLIDMEDRRNRAKVSQALQDALSTDKSPTKVLSFNDFGLIIMTRKRVKQSLERTMCSPCEYCEGAGWVKSPQTVCYEILTEARRLSKSVDDVRHTTLRVHPDVAKALRSSEREVLEEIEAYLGNIDVTSDPTIHQAQFDFAFI